MRGIPKRKRKVSEHARERIRKGIRRRQSQGLNFGAPRKHATYRFFCPVCETLTTETRGRLRKSCGKKQCRIIVAGLTRRKLPSDVTVVDLYLGGATSPEIAQMFGVEHHAVLEALKRSGCPRRRSGPRVRDHCKETGCARPVFRIWHKKNSCWYGTQCEEHRKIWRRQLNSTYKKKQAITL